MELSVIQSKISELRKSESTSKALIQELVVAVVDRVHKHDDVTSINTFIVALSDLNRKKVLAFAKKFTGHKEDEGIITGRRKDFKDKNDVTVRPYQEAKDAWDSFLESGLNFWQWCALDAVKEAKPITIESLQKKSKALEKQMKEALEAGIIDRTGAVQMLVGNIMTQQDMMAVLGAMIRAEEAVTKAVTQPSIVL